MSSTKLRTHLRTERWDSHSWPPLSLVTCPLLISHILHPLNPKWPTGLLLYKIYQFFFFKISSLRNNIEYLIILSASFNWILIVIYTRALISEVLMQLKSWISSVTYCKSEIHKERQDWDSEWKTVRDPPIITSADDPIIILPIPRFDLFQALQLCSPLPQIRVQHQQSLSSAFAPLDLPII